MPISDLYTQATNSTRPIPSTLTAIKGVGAASLSAAALTGWPTTTAVHFILYQITTGGVKIAGTQTDWKGVVSGATITNLVLKAGTDASYPIGTIIECGPTAAYANDLYAAATAEHTALGIHNAAAAATIAPLLPAGSIANVKLAADISPAKFANPYKFSVYRSAALTITTTGIVLFDTKVFDTGSNVDVVTNKGRFTAPVAGFYYFNTAIGIGISSNNSTAFATNLFKNGALVLAGNSHVNMYPGVYSITIGASGMLQLTAGDYVEVSIVCSGAGTGIAPGLSNNYFQGFLISTT